MRTRNAEHKGIAYRGYLIRSNSLLSTCWIEKDGYLIGWCKDVADAKETIDHLLD